MIKLNLQIREKDKKERNVTLPVPPGAQIIIGRTQNAQVAIDEATISRIHCVLVSNDKEDVSIQDKSSYGTWVNNSRLKKDEWRVVKDGDELLVGSTLVLVHINKGSLSDNAIVPPVSSETKDPNKPTVKYKLEDSNQPTPAQPSAPATATADAKSAAGASVTIKMEKIKEGTMLINETFGGYRLETVLGRGKMSTVYKATHLNMNRTVAVKVLSEKQLAVVSSVQRFMNVGKTASQLVHPNIVQIYDTGFFAPLGVYYIVMEYVEGETLEVMLARDKKLDLEHAFKLIGQIANALAFARKKNIVHRDVNPSNIMVSKNEVAKLIGLGLVKSLESEGISLTRPGEKMGTLGFISPEQFKDSSRVDHRSDIYSLGCVFYQAICGVTPYDIRNQNMMEYFRYLSEGVPPVSPHDLDPAVPLPVSNIIMKALSINPDERYQNADDFLAELKNYFTPSGLEEIDMDRAQQNLMAMFPSAFSTAGFQFDVIFKPCQKLGGDFFDFININNNKIAFVVGDVSGHGMEAALLVGMIKSTLKILAKLYVSPSKVLKLANAEIYPDLDSITFITIFYGVIDLQARELTFGRAGHMPLILYNPNRDPKIVMFKDTKGVAVGLVQDKFYVCEEVTVKLQPGDVLLEYTDGIVEAKNQNLEEFELERLCKSIEERNNAKSTPREILTNIEKSVWEFTGTRRQEDDITIVAIKV